MHKPEGNKPIYRMTYEECRRMVDAMEDTFRSDVFGVEKEEGKVEGILAAVYHWFLVLHAYCINYRIDHECNILEYATSKE